MSVTPLNMNLLRNLLKEAEKLLQSEITGPVEPGSPFDKTTWVQAHPDSRIRDANGDVWRYTALAGKRSTL